MPLLTQHDFDHPDPLMRPMQSFGSKLKRGLWLLTWAVFCRFTPNQFHAWRCFVLRLFGAKLGKNNFIYPSSRIWAPWLLETGEVATIASQAYVYNVGGMFIGHHAIVSEGAYLCGATHDHQDPDFPLISKRVEIGPYAWICVRAIVLPGVCCSEGAVLGAGAVCARDLEAWTVYAGNPAREVSKRNDISGEAS